MHLILLGVALATLPITLPEGWIPTADTAPVPWLLGVLTVSLGLPFFAISASGPLLQKWFSETGHPDARDPYFLYAASNIGSLLALLGYPLVVEPRLRLAAQSTWWAAGYVGLVLLFAACAFVVWRYSARIPVVGASAEDLNSSGRDAPPANRERVTWIALAFVPSSLLLGVTGYLTTDVAAVPLLWILPLALYLLTFVLVFARKRIISQRFLVRAQPLLALLLLLTIAWATTGPATLLYPLHLIAFFVLAMVAHGELARRKPSATHLTEFYLWMSFGGVLGGVFNVLIAPQIFDSMFEYPLVIALACAIRPPSRGDERLTAAGKKSLAVVVGALLSVLLVAFFVLEDASAMLSQMIPAVFVLAGVAVVRNRRYLTAVAMTLALLIATRSVLFESVLYDERTFFAVHRVMTDPSGEFYRYGHGTTIHGVQHRDPARRADPIGYYSKPGPVGQIFTALPPRDAGRSVAVVGLGTGGLACHSSPADQWTFYEIDPVVDYIARDLGYFSFLVDCTPDAATVLGDARITLGDAEAGAYDLIFLDAFTSDAIPAHLLTREALAMYLTKLKRDGVLVVNISNRHLDLEPMLARLARDAGLVPMIAEHAPTAEMQAEEIFSSRWLAMARSISDFGKIQESSSWRQAREKEGVDLWTDDFSNILSVIVWR